MELLRDGPARARVRLVLAHGAGAGMRSPFMQACAEALAARRISVVRFEFPYMQRRSDGGRAAIDKQPALLQCYRDVVAKLGGGARVIIGGKSMGGRMASMLADELGVRGLVCLGYPFHPPDAPDKLRTAHLANLKTPTLIVQGTRDEFGTRDEIAGYVLSPNIELCWVEDGDHSLKPRRKFGHDAKQAFNSVIARVAEFVQAQSAG